MIIINQATDVLLLVDIQNDFLPGGALAVSDGNDIIPVVNRLQKKFKQIIATQDFHPENHESFAANYSGKEAGQVIELDGLDQILWPVHCVQGTSGAEFSTELDQETWKTIVQKGLNPKVDSYSGFFDNAKRGDTGLNQVLKDMGVKRVFVVGLAQDYCVKFTTLDSKDLGFDTYLITDATKAVNLQPEDGDHALQEMKAAGIHLITSDQLN